MIGNPVLLVSRSPRHDLFLNPVCLSSFLAICLDVDEILRSLFNFILLIELALQRIEAQTSLVLSRQIGTPNIAAKGKLEPRRVWVPTWIAAGKHGSDEEEMEDKDAKGGKKKLIEVVEPSRKQGNREEGESAPSTLPKLKGILKNDGSKKSSEGGTKIASVTAAAIQDPPQGVPQTPQRPAWTWRKEADGQLKITVSVSKEVPLPVFSVVLTFGIDKKFD